MKNNEEILKRYIPVAKMIQKNFGDSCEVVIHNFEDYNKSVFYIKGNVTNRSKGAPITNVILKHLQKYKHDVEDLLAFTTRTQDGKILKTSISFIRDDKNKVIGCIGINYDISSFLLINNVVSDFTKTLDLKDEEFENEYYENDLEDTFERLLEVTIKSIGKPVSEMKREDKRKVVLQLEAKGAFLLQGAVEKISDRLSVTKQTVYNYLDK